MANNLNTNEKPFVYPFVLPKRASNVVHIRQKNAYPELARFRQRLLSHETANLSRPYCFYRRKTRFYLAIFSSLSVSFFSLFTYLLFYKASLFGGLTLEIGMAMKGAGCLFSFFLFIASLTICCSLSADREAVNYLWRQEKIRLKYALQKKKLKHGLRSLMPSFACSIMHSINEEYYRAIEQMEEIKEHARFLLRRLRQAESLEPKERDRVRNQALLDMQEQLRGVVHNFQS